jgi:hypothetical protein
LLGLEEGAEVTGNIVAAVTAVAVPAAGLIAQVDAISGGAGWAGAGLLGLVLGWLLLKHLPDKDRMIREIIKEHDTIEREIVTAANESVDRARREFTESLRYVVDKQEQQNKELILAIQRDFERIISVDMRRKQQRQEGGS